MKRNLRYSTIFFHHFQRASNYRLFIYFVLLLFCLFQYVFFSISIYMYVYFYKANLSVLLFERLHILTSHQYISIS
jgi:hypothetical protein